MSLGFAVVQLDVTVVNVALKTIGSSFGGGIAGLQWVVNAYTVVFASLILTSGALGDRLGAKRLFIGGFIVFVAASMACGAAPSLIILIAARAVRGIGAAVLVPCSLALWWQTVMMGGGIGLTVPPMTSALLATVDRKQSGVASGVLNTTRQLGSVVGVSLFGSLIADRDQLIPGMHLVPGIGKGLRWQGRQGAY